MKYKLIGILMLVFVVSITFLLSNIENSDEHLRYHQHLNAKKESVCLSEDELCTHLPIIKINTNNQQIPGNITNNRDKFDKEIYSLSDEGLNVIKADLAIIDNKNINNHENDKSTISSLIDIRIRGNHSRHFDKKSYDIHLIDENGLNNNLSILSMDKHHDFALYGPFQDMSLIRNYMWYNIAGEIMDYAPNVRYVELIINDEYQGLYLLSETVTNGDNCRLNLNEKIKGTEFDGYLVRFDRTSEKDLNSISDIYTFNERSCNLVQDAKVEYPGIAKLNKKIVKEIEEDFSIFEKCLYSYDYDHENYGYFNFIDVDNFIDYYIINEISANEDAGKYSTYIYREIGEKYKLAVWDFNDSCDNGYNDITKPKGFYMTNKPLFYMLFKDENFANKVIDRYYELRKTFLSDEYLMNYIDETGAYLGNAIKRNHDLWKDELSLWLTKSTADRRVMSQEEASINLKNWILERTEWLDDNIGALKALSHPSRNKQFDH